ncbi:hypothetical protein GF340_02555 [Candidatus Peregrinibacteria bacterium]|nr:hypothetical protein [Candidatus Peregrinibacteria bacterium]
MCWGNKLHTIFKLSNRIAFDIKWSGTYTWKVEMKLDPGTVDDFKGNQWEFQRYDDGFNNAIFRPLEAEKTDLTELEIFFEIAYQNIAGID